MVSPNTSYILIVDDTLENLQVLAKILKERGYKVRPVSDGNLALQAAQNEPPALVLLDISMPEMDGYEVCARLKANEKLKEIPVIFISAMNDTIDKVKAFAVGGVDYVTKPFQLDEVVERISTHLKLREQKHLLQENYDKLKNMEALKDSLIHMIIHDMRSPLQAVIGFLDLVEISGDSLTEDTMDNIRSAKNASETLINMVSSLLDINKMELGEMKLNLSECELVTIMKRVVSKMDSMKKNRKIILNFPDKPVNITCDSDLIYRVIQNLLSNAFKFTSDEHGEIRIGIERKEDAARISVQDNGPGIPTEYHDKLFKKFSQVEIRSYSTGLGLTFCKMAIEAHGGNIGVESAVGKGSNFWFILPGYRRI